MLGQKEVLFKPIYGKVFMRKICFYAMFHKLFNIQHILPQEVSEYFISIKHLEATSEQYVAGYFVLGLEISPYYLRVFDNYIGSCFSLPMKNETFSSWMCSDSSSRKKM